MTSFAKRAKQEQNRPTCMQTKSSGIFINDYNLSGTTRKSVKINSTSASLLCNLCFSTHITGQNDRETVHFAEPFLQHSCALHSAKNLFVQIYQLVEITELQNANGETRYICYFGPMSMNDNLLADSTDRSKVLFLSTYSANKQFFKIGKV